MRSVLGHIVQKHLSQENENIATESLAFILRSSHSARRGLIKLLRGIEPQLPELWFRTQQMEGNTRPDMWGLDDGARVHVFIENKFWAGLTENQPVSYLQTLAKMPHQSVLLVVAPETRERPVWRELVRRLDEAKISMDSMPESASCKQCIQTSIGPILALTSWSTLLSFIEAETVEDLEARENLSQLRSLCEIANENSFSPLSAEQISDQRLPSFVLQLADIVSNVVQLANDQDLINCGGLMPQSRPERSGRYVRLGSKEGYGCWLGIHYGLWRDFGQSPFWLVFDSTDFGRSPEVRNLLEPWAAQNKHFTTSVGVDEYVVAIDLPIGEEQDETTRYIVDQLAGIGQVLGPKKGEKPGAFN